MATCPHIENYNLNLQRISELASIIKHARGRTCFDCNCKNNLYLCLNNDCDFLGCARDEKGHALKHCKKNTHMLTINCFSLQIWCYVCDDFVANWELLDALQTAVDGSDEKSIKSIETSASPIQATHNVVGLYNIGNSCFINSALQVLLNCPAVVGYFRDCSAYISSLSNHRLSECFMTLVDIVGHSESSAISPSKFIRVASSFNPSFHGYSQQDSMDFMRFLLDRMHEELKYSFSAELLDSKNRRKSGRLASKQNGTTNNEPEIIHKSVISDTFGGFLRSEVTCQKCGSVSVKDDQFFDLSLPLAPLQTPSKGYMSNFLSSLGETFGIGSKGAKLEHYLANFCLPELLDGKDRYFCEKCKTLVQSVKALSIKELPEVLCFQLKRFRHDSYFSSKINTSIQYPLRDLNMQPFIHKDFTSHANNKHCHYELIAIINHRGSFNGGHYVAYCRQPGSLNWLEFDDSCIRNVREEEIENVQAYLLFYVRRPDESSLINRSRWLPAILHQQGDPSQTVFVSKSWFNKWLYFDQPGPIDSLDVLCPHSNLKARDNETTVNPLSLVQPLPKVVADEFIQEFGDLGGCSVITSPIECPVCIEEQQVLRRRRVKEEEEILSLDTSTIGDGEAWYLIDSSWLSQWGQFKSGGPPPGPISNHRLLSSTSKDDDSSILTHPRPNLLRGTHYRGINERVWNYFYGIYGGGPVIRRKTINIYGNPA